MKVAVIGGGPSGLTSLKHLLHAHEYFPIQPIEARLFEAHTEIGGTFVQRVYEDAELVSSKYLTAFSDFRLPRDAPDFVSPDAYVQYLREYASHFNLLGSIELQSKVHSISRSNSGTGHVVTICHTAVSGESMERWTCDAIAVCSGVHFWPDFPEIRGLERVPVVMHSSELKTRAQFGSGKNVVILGAGETAMDIAHLAITSPTKSVTICHRHGFFCAPKTVPVPRATSLEEARSNKPVDSSVASLFDTAYVHPWLQRGPLPFLAYDMWIKGMHKLISGTQEGPDQWVGHMSKERKHIDAVFACKSDRAIPYISAGHRSRSWWNRMRSAVINVYIEDTGQRTIDVMTWPNEVDNNGFMNLKDGISREEQHIKPDIVILATGYRAHFPFLDESYPSLAQADVRCIYRTEDVDVGFIGFVRPSIGAIPPLAELQAQLWIFRLLQDRMPDEIPHEPFPDSLATYELDWKLHARAGHDIFATKRGVDHESYAYQLALDMGAAPTISFVASRGWRVLYTWAMGPNFNTKFRLVGPWKWEDGASEIMATELFDIVKRSGGLVYFVTYTVIPFVVFGGMSIFLYIISYLVHPVRRLRG